MGYELTVFVILTLLVLGLGIVNVFHIRPKEKPTDRRMTAHGLIWLSLFAWSTVTLLIMGGII